MSKRENILTVQFYADLEPGYCSALESNEDVAQIIGSIEGELDGYEDGQTIKAFWSDDWHEMGMYTYITLHRFTEKAKDVLGAWARKRSRGRIVFWWDEREIMVLTSFVNREEWEANDKEFAGW